MPIVTSEKSSRILSSMRIAAPAQTRITNGTDRSLVYCCSQSCSLYFLSDFNFVKQGDKCVPVGPEPIPAGVCKDPDGHYMGSSGFRRIPGNTCEGGKRKDEKVQKPCSSGEFPLPIQGIRGY